MSDKRRPRPSTGVMAYVAELQQFDPVPPVPVPAEVPSAQPAEPVPTQPSSSRPVPPAQIAAAQSEAVRSEASATIDITPGAFVAPVSSGGPRRRLRIGLLVGAALAAAVVGGVGYAALIAPGADVVAPKSAGSAPAPADGGSTPGVPGVPGLAPIATQTAGPRSSATTGGSGPGAAGGPGGTVDIPATQPVPTRQGPTTPAQTDPAQTKPDQPVDPGPGETTPAPPPGQGQPRPLTGLFTHTADVSADGISGYAGSIRIDNPRPRAAQAWHVTLTVPGGNPVYGDDRVNVAQDGERVTFTSAGDAGTVPAGGSTTFTFTVQGMLAAEPANCAVNGHPCT